jgi:hypothetical protein
MRDWRWGTWSGSGDKKGRIMRELRENVYPKGRGQESLAEEISPVAHRLSYAFTHSLALTHENKPPSAKT